MEPNRQKKQRKVTKKREWEGRKEATKKTKCQNPDDTAPKPPKTGGSIPIHKPESKEKENVKECVKKEKGKKRKYHQKMKMKRDGNERLVKRKKEKE